MQSEDEPSTSRAVSPNPIQRFLGRWPWWSAEGKAQAAGKMQPSERPFAKDPKKKGWLEEASTPLGRVKAPQIPELYRHHDNPQQAYLQVRDTSCNANFILKPQDGKGWKQMYSWQDLHTIVNAAWQAENHISKPCVF